MYRTIILLTLVVLFSANLIDAGAADEFDAIKEKKAKEERSLKQVRDKLLLERQIGSAEQVDELLGPAIELKPTNCHRQLDHLAATIGSLKEGAAKRYLENARTLLGDYCKVIELSATDNFSELAKSPKLVENLFGKKLVANQKSEGETVELNELDSQEFALLVAESGESKYGDINRDGLIGVAASVDKCQLDELQLILDAALKSFIHN